nr:TadE/TadG family type IV pilus assembly protein [Parapontixanthobacter aurantiacus]
MRFVRAFIRDRSGAAAAEMALMVPLLMILMFGGFEAGHYFYTEHKIVKAVRDGARYAGRLPFSAYDCGSGTSSQAALIQNVTRTGVADTTAPPLIYNWTDNADVTVSVTCNTAETTKGIFTDLASGAPVVTVSATASYPSLFGALGLLDADINVAANAQAVVNGL